MFEILYLAKIGLIAGVIMGMAAMILQMIKFTTLDLTKYVGCLLTGHAAGRVNFVAGFVAHLCASAFFSILYAYILEHFMIAVSLRNAVHFGVLHTLISGCLVLPMFDRMNPCVAQGSIKRMNYLASGYGVSAVITYTAGHIIYAVAVFFMLAR